MLWVGQQQTFGSQRLCPVGQQAWVPGHGLFFLGVLDFVNGGADTVLWYCSVLFYVFRLPAVLEGS